MGRAHARSVLAWRDGRQDNLKRAAAGLAWLADDVTDNALEIRLLGGGVAQVQRRGRTNSAPSRVLRLACRLNFCFFSNSPTTVWLILCPRLSSSAASRRRLLHVQRSGDIGSPRASGSTSAFRSSSSRCFRQRFASSPGRRTPLTFGGGGAPRSFRPRPIVLAAMRVTRETAAMPPCPAALASDAAKSRRCRSSS